MTEVAEQATKILGPLSRTATVWSIDLGLRLGSEQLVECPSGATADEVANALDLDPRYTHVILRRRMPPSSSTSTAAGTGWASTCRPSC